MVTSRKGIDMSKQNGVRGIIKGNCVYTEDELCNIIGISKRTLIDWYKLGLKSFRPSRRITRQVTGDEYHRFVAANSTAWNEEG